MIRRFVILTIALTLALGMSGGMGGLNAKPVHAVGAACYATDQDGIVYPDGYFFNGYQTVVDTLGGSHQVGFDLQAYRLSVGNSCLRSYYVSTWVNDRSPAASLTAHMRVWICGQPAADFQQDAYNTWGRAVVAYHQNLVWGAWPGPGGVAVLVNTPDGHQWVLEFADYTPCGRQADNWISQAYAPNWSPNTAFVYVNVNG